MFREAKRLLINMVSPILFTELLMRSSAGAPVRETRPSTCSTPVTPRSNCIQCTSHVAIQSWKQGVVQNMLVPEVRNVTP
eukprot:10049125-Karenia_brevis.AAC.1